MEMFVFPELMYSLVLANIMSPIIWKWRQDETFKKLEGKSPYRTLMRMRQYIMDEYEFNLDLNTWGLTTRTSNWPVSATMSPPRHRPQQRPVRLHGRQVLLRRRHPPAFRPGPVRRRHHPLLEDRDGRGHGRLSPQGRLRTGAGECVSLSTLYAAAAFIVCGIPLEDIYMVLTPLHSQNFIDINDGIITNNRRLVTKACGSTAPRSPTRPSGPSATSRSPSSPTTPAISTAFYDDATIDPAQYERFQPAGSDLNVGAQSPEFRQLPAVLPAVHQTLSVLPVPPRPAHVRQVRDALRLRARQPLPHLRRNL
jgi:hypothetical protein